MRLDDVGHRQDGVDHGTDVSPLDDAREFGEAAGGRVVAEELDPPGPDGGPEHHAEHGPDDAIQVEGEGDHAPSPVEPGLVGADLRAHQVDDDIEAAEVLRPGRAVVQGGVGPEFPDPVQIARACQGGDLGTERLAELHHCAADAPGRAPHQEPLTGDEVSLVGQRRHRGGTGHRKGGGLEQAQVLGRPGQPLLGDGDVVGHGSEGEVRHEPPHRVPGPPLLHLGAHRRDASGEVAAHTTRERGAADAAHSADAER